MTAQTETEKSSSWLLRLWVTGINGFAFVLRGANVSQLMTSYIFDLLNAGTCGTSSTSTETWRNIHRLWAGRSPINFETTWMPSSINANWSV
jgi:hypothetical protein